MLDGEHTVCYIHQQYPDDEQPRNNKNTYFCLVLPWMLEWFSVVGEGEGGYFRQDKSDNAE